MKILNGGCFALLLLLLGCEGENGAPLSTRTETTTSQNEDSQREIEVVFYDSQGVAVTHSKIPLKRGAFRVMPPPKQKPAPPGDYNIRGWPPTAPPMDEIRF